LAVTYERFDRFDPTLLNLLLANKVANTVRNLQQESWIISANYALNPWLQLNFAYHHLNNPLPWVSHVWNLVPANRIMLTFEAHL
jgi:hypothetical protein